MLSDQIRDTAAGIVHYENADIPLRIKQYAIEGKVTRRIIPHWHDDFELVQVLNGALEYVINDDCLIMQKGDFLFVNSRVMHMSARHGEGRVDARCLLFQPRLLSPNPLVQSSFIEPIWENSPFEYIFFPRNTEESGMILSLMNEIYAAKEENRTAYEMEVIGHLHQILAIIYRYTRKISPHIDQRSPAADSRKSMLSFIYHRYMDKISLEDIAGAGHVSKHRCCELFKEMLGYTPVEYLNIFRLEMAARILVSTDRSVQDVANTCGIESSAYFIKMFRERFHMTPKEYRRTAH